jgi:hypothetical protein
MTHHLSKQALIAAVIGVSAAALGPAAVADAYAGSCVGPIGSGSILQVREFSLQNVDADNSLATVAVDAAMSESDAQLFVDRPGDKADFLLFGDDDGSDQLLVTFKPERYWVSPAGLGMRGSIRVANGTLNEDGLKGLIPSPTAEDILDKNDEFYVDIRMGDVRNGSAHRVETCRLTLPS